MHSSRALTSSSTTPPHSGQRARDLGAQRRARPPSPARPRRAARAVSGCRAHRLTARAQVLGAAPPARRRPPAPEADLVRAQPVPARLGRAQPPARRSAAGGARRRRPGELTSTAAPHAAQLALGHQACRRAARGAGQTTSRSRSPTGSAPASSGVRRPRPSASYEGTARRPDPAGCRRGARSSRSGRRRARRLHAADRQLGSWHASDLLAARPATGRAPNPRSRA